MGTEIEDEIEINESEKSIEERIVEEIIELKHQRNEDASKLRKILGMKDPEFANNGQKDVAEFIVKLNEVLKLDEKLKIEIKVKMTCQNENCGDSKYVTQVVNEEIHTLVEKQVMFDEPLNDDSIVKILSKSKEETIKKKCEKCSENNDVDFKCKRELVSTSDVILVSLKRFLNDPMNGTSEKIKRKVDPSLKITVGGQRYQLKGVIEHHGNTMKSGHYTCTLRSENDWVKVNDDCISRTSKPTDGYVFLYEKGTGQAHVIQQNQILPSTEPESSLMQPKKVKKQQPKQKTKKY